MKKIPHLSEFSTLFMVGLPGTVLDPSTRNLITDYHICNFILFKRNVANHRQLRCLCSDLHNACLQNGLPRPLISIDQEGGAVSRLPPPFTQFADPRAMADSRDPEKTLKEYAKICARELMEVGVTMNLAPVLDICRSGQNSFMLRRCLGEEPEQVAKLGQLIIQELQNNGIAACAKHFPGLGAAEEDPHQVLPFVNRPAQELLSIDLAPFRAALGAGVAAVMTSHAIYNELDKDTPATLSRKILTDLLRVELGYDGLLITDDLEMGAIVNANPLELAAVESLRAGADILLICENHEKVLQSIEAVSQGLSKGFLSRDDIRKKSKRQMVLREKFSPPWG